jgi:cytochrome c peroxidase
MRAPPWWRACAGAVALLLCRDLAAQVPLLSPKAASTAATSNGASAGFDWKLPPGFPVPYVPAGNPLSAAKVALGRLLFFEPRLSIDGRTSCSTCHRPELAFTDGKPRALGATGQLHPRSAMSLANVAYNPSFTWADPSFDSLEAQVLQPMYNEHPVEMGLTGREAEVVAALRTDPRYPGLFASAFSGSGDPISITNVARAIASFERTLISGRSAFDRYVFDDDRSALSTTARRGMALFYSERAGCAQCHSGINFSGAVRTVGAPTVVSTYANTALYNIDGHGSYPPDAPGIRSVTGNAQDEGRFRVPTLRNITVTAPYMHDGSIATLTEVIEHYSAGGRQAPLGPSADNALKDGRIHSLQLSAQDKADLIAFLESLTDEEFLHDRRFRAD